MLTKNIKCSLPSVYIYIYIYDDENDFCSVLRKQRINKNLERKTNSEISVSLPLITQG